MFRALISSLSRGPSSVMSMFFSGGYDQPEVSPYSSSIPFYRSLNTIVIAGLWAVQQAQASPCLSAACKWGYEERPEMAGEFAALHGLLPCSQEASWWGCPLPIKVV
ncbi:hypothetical protein SCP_0304620 [Sparassis crispa]|uniref:Uncharacterized protein n=1 Tax=Sparassis crispa TaxID=139825 RepID=A0A401GF63_9APHY|nr:hypothetical protein SCP_0304620 [Sparassis crispa]GBE80743.1 hypothetical protein SCP_0304620 [Sparassis crispa]